MIPDELPPLLPFTVTRSVTSGEMPVAVESRDASLEILRVIGFNPCPLIADSTVSDLIVPWKRLENSLRVHDDVNVSGRSAIRDAGRLISLVPKSGPLTTLQKKKV